MHAAMGEVDDIPAQRHQLGRLQPMPVRDEHHSRVTVASFREVAGNRYPGTDTRGVPVYGQELVREPDSADRQRAGGELDVRVVKTYPNYRKRHWGDQVIQAPFQTGYRCVVGRR